MFDTLIPVRFEVEVRVGQPLDSTARQFLDGLMRSADKVVGYRADGDQMVVTVEAQAMDESGRCQRRYARWHASTRWRSTRWWGSAGS